MADEDNKKKKTTIGAIIGALLIGVGFAADFSGIVSFTTGLSLPQIIGGNSSKPSATPQQATPESRRTSTPESRETKSGTPRPTKPTRSEPPPPSKESEKANPAASTWPSHDQIVSCLERRYLGGYQDALDIGLKKSDIGDRVRVRIHIDPADQAYTFWRTDAGCNSTKVFKISPGQDRTYVGWGGGLWDMEIGSRGPQFDGPGPFTRDNSTSTYTFEVGRTTVTYTFES